MSNEVNSKTSSIKASDQAYIRWISTVTSKVGIRTISGKELLSSAGFTSRTSLIRSSDI